MSRKLFFQELFSQNWAIDPSAIESLRSLAAKRFELMNTKPEPLKVIIRSRQDAEEMSAETTAQYNPGENPDIFKDYPAGSIAILPLIGIMTKYGSWWTWGVDEIADLIRSANAAQNISGMVLIINTPGGAIDSIYQIVDAIKNSTKPIYGFVDGMSCSAGEYVRSHLLKSFALHDMCTFGSIGVMATFRDYTKNDELYGIKTTVIYPPESKYKNLPEREAMEGKPDLIIKEQLTPWAKHFQEVMKTNLPVLKTDVEGILEGKTFFASDSVTYGLVDGIKNLDEVVAELFNEISTRESILSI